MIVRPTEFGMIQQQNTVAQIRHGEDAKPMAEQQTMVAQSQKEADIRSEQVNHKDNADNRQRKFDAKDKSDNEYHSLLLWLKLSGAVPLFWARCWSALLSQMRN